MSVGAIRVVVGHGSPRSVGRAHAEAAADLVRASVKYYGDLLRAGGEEPVRRVSGLVGGVERELPYVVEELAAVAEGAGVPRESVLAANVYADALTALPHCTNIGIVTERGAFLANGGFDRGRRAASHRASGEA